MFFSHTLFFHTTFLNFLVMVLTKLVKGLIHVSAKNGDLQYSYWSCGDYTNYVDAKCETQKWCNEMNEETGYEKYTCEVVDLYGEAIKW